MKKWTTLASAMVLTLAALAAFAYVPQDSVNLGGIGYGTDGSYVQQIYGAPTEIDREHASAVEFEYGDSVSIHLSDNRVYRVEVSANNGWQTPEGVHVGMAASAVEETYGPADVVRGDTLIYTVAGAADLGMEFEIENGKIEEIEIGKIH